MYIYLYFDIKIIYIITYLTFINNMYIHILLNPRFPLLILFPGIQLVCLRLLVLLVGLSFNCALLITTKHS